MATPQQKKVGRGVFSLSLFRANSEFLPDKT